MRLGLRGKDFPSIKNWLNESKSSVRNFPGSIASIANRCRDCAPASFSIKEDSAEYWSVSQLRDGMVFTPAKWRRKYASRSRPKGDCLANKTSANASRHG